MKKLLLTLSFAVVPAIAPAAFAATEAPLSASGQQAGQDQRREAWKALTPEQRQAKRQEMRARREANMTPEQRAQRAARRKAWEAMTPEQRQAKRQEMRGRRGHRRAHDSKANQ